MDGIQQPISTMLDIMFFWSMNFQQHQISRLAHTVASRQSMINYLLFFREVCELSLCYENTKIGGPGKIVEIDEAKFGKRKYNRGIRVEGVWVLGGVERNSSGPTEKAFFCVVEDRSAKTLLPLIFKNVLPGTKIFTDEWRGYSRLDNFLDYEHITINHSESFVNSEDSTIHTNTIEGRWTHVRRAVPNTRRGFYAGYFFEHIYRLKHKNNLLKQFLNDLAIFYNANREDLTLPQIPEYIETNQRVIDATEIVSSWNVHEIEEDENQTELSDFDEDELEDEIYIDLLTEN